MQDISEECICISTKYTFPLNSRVELLIPHKSKIMGILTRVNRYEHIDSLYDIMSVQVLNSSQEYLEFKNSFEKRMWKRIPVGLEAEFTSRDMGFACLITNISDCGLNTLVLSGKDSLDSILSDTLSVRLNIPSGVKLILHCQKVWANVLFPNRASMNVGMEIINPPAQYKEFVQTFE